MKSMSKVTRVNLYCPLSSFRPSNFPLHTFRWATFFFVSAVLFFGNSPRGEMRQGPVGVSGLQLCECMHLCECWLVNAAHTRNWH